LLDGLKIGRDKVGISMLQIANDTMFMCKAIKKNIITIKGIVRCLGWRQTLKLTFLRAN